MSAADAIEVLREIANTETQVAQTYKKFNDPTSGDLHPVLFDKTAILRANIDKVYQRSTIRRDEFHKMTEPVVANPGRISRGPTYRVHFSDPERRYVSSLTEGVARKSKAWYRAMWKRLLEPIFQETVLKECKDTRLRNIVLVDSDVPQENTQIEAYVRNRGADLVIHCANIDLDHALVDYVLRHEYEHVVDETTEGRTSRRFVETEDPHHPDTLTKDTLQRNIREIDAAQGQLQRAQYAVARAAMHEGAAATRRAQAAVKMARHRWNALEGHRATWEGALRDMLSTIQRDTFNVDGGGGFPSWYARESMFEAVAEQRYAMRNEAIRTALLRRMAFDQPGAARQKQFYDIAREEMKLVDPALYTQWGKNYDNVAQKFWGLLPGTTAQADKHHQILALDKTLATKIATERLATHFLQRGYDVALMGQTTHRVYDPVLETVTHVSTRVCKLQSNLRDPSPGDPHLPSVLHLVGGSGMDGEDVAFLVYDTFRDFTPTGRPNTAGIYTPNVEEVSIVWSPRDPFLPPVSDRVEFVQNFREAFIAIAQDTKSNMPRRISILNEHSIIAPILGDVDIWPRNANLYRDAIFDGWFLDNNNNKEVWESVDEEEQAACMPL
eukprot:GEMP01009724.1.p1 GENE.GEMP01009724.1~~GEMP01009724.1.p1  ORF type:complete len:612 (+),score=146.42 GEMP01009724.1:655-2490(+)